MHREAREHGCDTRKIEKRKAAAEQWRQRRGGTDCAPQPVSQTASMPLQLEEMHGTDVKKGALDRWFYIPAYAASLSEVIDQVGPHGADGSASKAVATRGWHLQANRGWRRCQVLRAFGEEERRRGQPSRREMARLVGTQSRTEGDTTRSTREFTIVQFVKKWVETQTQTELLPRFVAEQLNAHAQMFLRTYLDGVSLFDFYKLNG